MPQRIGFAGLGLMGSRMARMQREAATLNADVGDEDDYWRD